MLNCLYKPVPECVFSFPSFNPARKIIRIFQKRSGRHLYARYPTKTLSYLSIYLFIYSTSPGKITRMTCIQYKYNIIQVTNGGYTTTVKTNYCVPLTPGGYEEFKSWELSKGECVNARLLTFNVVYVVKHCITLHANTRVFFELWS
jgi:hypothetical protein